MSLSEENLRSGLGYSVSLEVTHHGPTGLGVPVVFVEIGSSVDQWRDGRAAEVAAEAVMRAAGSDLDGLSAVGFGGGHYAPDFTRLEFEGELAFGHIVPKDAVGGLDARLTRRLFERTWGGCRLAVLDWKGVRGVDREALLRSLRDQDVEVLKS
jgi:D-aminoacyl-tRNA deacylase